MDVVGKPIEAFEVVGIGLATLEDCDKERVSV